MWLQWSSHLILLSQQLLQDKYHLKIDGTTIDDAENLDLVIPMYNLLEYSLNCSETTGNLWFYSKDEGTNFNTDIANTNKSLKFNANLLGKTVARNTPNQANWILKNASTAVALKYLSNFWRSLVMPLINCKIELKFKWTKYCVFSANGNDNVNDNDNTSNIIFTIRDTKVYVPVVNLSAKDNQKILKLLSKGFESSVYLNEYKTKSENKNTTNDYICFLESTFVGVNGLFVLVYSNEDENAKRFRTWRCYLTKGVIKIITLTLMEKTFMINQVILIQIYMKKLKILTARQGDDYTIECLLHYDYTKNYCRLIAVDLIRQKEWNADPKAILQIEFVWQLKNSMLIKIMNLCLF